MMRLLTILCVGLPLLVSGIATWADEIAAEAEVRARLTGIALDGSVRGLYYWDGSEYQPINFYPGTRSGVMRYAGPRTFSLFERSEDAEGATIHLPAASTTLKGGASDYLLFVSRDVGTSSVKLLAIQEDLSDFKVGNYRFINLTPKKLALKLGDMRALISPMNFTDFSPDFDHGTSYETLLVELPAEEAPPKRLYHSSLFYNENSRMLYMISERGNGSVKLTGVPQMIPSN